MLFPPPALRERGHRSLARCGIAMRRRAILMIPEGQRPQPRRIYRRGSGSHDAADHDALGEHVKVVVVPFTRTSAARGADHFWQFVARLCIWNGWRDTGLRS